MAFDISKYQDYTFNNDENIDRKIKALLSWFDYQTHVNNYSINEQISLVENIIKLCIKQEWYEIASFFKNKKTELLKK